MKFIPIDLAPGLKNHFLLHSSLETVMIPLAVGPVSELKFGVEVLWIQNFHQVPCLQLYPVSVL